MEDTDSTPASGADHNPATITQLADEIVNEMQQRKAGPSTGLLVDCMEVVRERIPYSFDEQILLLKALRQSCMTLLKKSGKIGFLRELDEIIEQLELGGEVPGHSFGLVIERVPQMDPYTAARYLDGVRGLAEMARSRGAVRDLIALLSNDDDRSAPFAWSSKEWKHFDAVVEQHAVNIRMLLGTAPVVREEQSSAAGYPSDASAPPEPASVGNQGGKLRWTSTLVLLVFFSDLFRKVGVIDPTMTDAEIIACC